MGGDDRVGMYVTSSPMPAEAPRMGGDDRVIDRAFLRRSPEVAPRTEDDDKVQVQAPSWRLKMRGIPGVLKARGEFPVAPTSHKTADIRFERGAWWFSICVEMPARRQKGEQSLKVEFDLIDSFAVVKTADGGCPAGLSDPFSDGRKGESRSTVSGLRDAPCGKPSNEGETQGAVPAFSVDALKSERDRRFKKFSYRWKQWTRRIAVRTARESRRRHHILHEWTSRVAASSREVEILAPPKRALQSGKGDAARPGAQVETIAKLNRHVLAMAPASAIQMLEYKLAEAGAACAVARREDHQIGVGRDLRAAAVTARKAARITSKRKEMAHV